MKKRWKCTICGYVHVGNDPPEICPICGSDSSKFILLGHKKSHFFHELTAAFKLHPVVAHFPNGLMPTAALFLGLFLFTANSGFEATAFWLVLTLTIVVPVSIGSGLHDWYKYIAKRRAPIFAKKISLALMLLVLGLVAILLRYGQPDLLMTAGWQRWLYLLCLIGMLGCVALLGHFGSLLAVQVAQNPIQTHAENPAAKRDENDNWLRSIVTFTPDAILAADTSGVIRLWNHGAERIFSVSAGEAIGQSLDLIIPENLRQRHWEGWAKVMTSGVSRYGEDELLRVPAIRGDGQRFSAEFSIIMLKDSTGEVTGVATILRDVSEQWEKTKELKAQLDVCQNRPS
jgi:PAS domain S-box-containing protein